MSETEARSRQPDCVEGSRQGQPEQNLIPEIKIKEFLFEDKIRLVFFGVSFLIQSGSHI